MIHVVRGNRGSAKHVHWHDTLSRDSRRRENGSCYLHDGGKYEKVYGTLREDLRSLVHAGARFDCFRGARVGTEEK
jgi:hypothetical protein